MIKEKLKDIIAQRIAIDQEYDHGIEQLWNEAKLLVKKNPEAVLEFVAHDGTEEEVYWFSEILCDIYDMTLDERFVEAFKNRADKMDDAEMQRSIYQEIGHI